jgi:hypothetical protein
VRVSKALFGVLSAATVRSLVRGEGKRKQDAIPFRAVQNRIARCDDLLFACCATHAVSICWLTELYLTTSLPEVQEAYGHRVVVVPEILLLWSGAFNTALAVGKGPF